MYQIGIAMMIGALRACYWPMKLRKIKRKIVFVSRQSDIVSMDVQLLANELNKDGEIEIVFRFRTMGKGVKNLISYGMHMLGDMWHLANASVAVCDTYSIPISCLHHKKGLCVIQIWHALGALKKFGLQSVGRKEGRNEAISKAMHMHEGYDCVFAPSKATAQFYAEAFGTSLEKIRVLTLPRVDYILQDQEKVRAAFLCDHPEYQGKKIVLYLPTFREGEDEIVEGIQKVFEETTEFAFVVSLHPLSKHYVPQKYHTYDLMKAADVIITDYSASAFESAVLGKPLYFYVPDYERYQTNRGLNISLEDEMKEATFKDAKKLVEVIRKEEYNKSELEQFRNKYVENTECCTKKMAEYIRSMLNV